MSSPRENHNALHILLGSGKLDTPSLINLSSLNSSIREFTKNMLAESLVSSGVLSDERLLTTLILPSISKRSQNMDFIAKVLSNLGFINSDAKYDIDLISQLIKAIKASGYSKPMHMNIVCYNLTFFGNSEVLEAIAEEEIELPHKLHEKAARKLVQYQDGKYPDKYQRYLESYQFLIGLELKKVIAEMMRMIKEHSFVLNGRGDSTIKEIDHPISKHAAKIYKLLQANRHSDKLTTEFDKIAQKIIDKLGFSKGGWLYSNMGKRDSSTTELYSNILKKVTEGRMLANSANKLINQEDKDDLDIRF